MANRTNQFFDIHDARRSELLPRQAYPNLINETCKLREPWSNTPTVPRCSFWMVSSSGSISQHAEQVSVSYLNGYWSFSVFEFWRLGLWRVSPRKSLFLKSLSFWSLSFSRGAIVTASIGYLFIYLPWKWSSCRSEAIQREKEPRFSFFSSPLLLSVSGNDRSSLASSLSPLCPFETAHHFLSLLQDNLRVTVSPWYLGWSFVTPDRICRRKAG